MNYSLHLDGELPITTLSGTWTNPFPARLERVLNPIDFSYGHIEVVVQDLVRVRTELKKMTVDQRWEAVERWMKEMVSKKGQWFELNDAETARAPMDLEREWSSLIQWFEQLSRSREQVQQMISHPRGVMAIVGSSVWPLYYGVRDLLFGLLAGNPVVMKPSEKVTRSLSSFLASVRASSSELNRYWSLLAGDREMSRRLSLHSEVSVVLFRGTFEAGMRVRQEALGQPQKIILLYLGSKNSAWIRDLSEPQLIPTLIQDCFLASGQHCRSVSNIWVASDVFDEFIETFHEAAKKYKIVSNDSTAFAGPMLDSAGVDRFLKFSGIAEREGAELLMRGKLLERVGQSLFVTPTLALFREITPEGFKKSVALQTEILAPHVNLVRWDPSTPTSEWTRADAHGHLACLWGAEPSQVDLETFKDEYGQVLWNRSVFDLGLQSTYQVRKKSGNEAIHGSELLMQLTRRTSS